MKDVFTKIERGKRLKNSEHISGAIPYVSSSGINNGVDDFVCNENAKYFENCLTIANSGSVGSTFYQQYKFVGSDHITALKNDNFDKYIYLFFIPIISRLNKKYSFNREINDVRIRKEKVLLPVNENDEIDYNFMKDYSQYILAKILKKYMEYINEKYNVKG